MGKSRLLCGQPHTTRAIKEICTEVTRHVPRSCRHAESSFTWGEQADIHTDGRLGHVPQEQVAALFALWWAWAQEQDVCAGRQGRGSSSRHGRSGFLRVGATSCAWLAQFVDIRAVSVSRFLVPKPRVLCDCFFAVQKPRLLCLFWVRNP